MSVIQNENTVRLTGIDAFQYEYNAYKGIKGLIKGIASFLLGRKITLVEAQTLLIVPAPVDPPTVRLSERRASESVPEDESQSVTVVTQASSSIASLSPPTSFSSSEGVSLNEDSTKATPEIMAIPKDMATAEDMTAVVEEPSRSTGELVDDFEHLNLFNSDKKLLRSLAGGSDVFDTQPEPLHENILDVLELGKDFLDQGRNGIMTWLESSDFMDKAARPETAALVKHIVHRSVYEKNIGFFIDICASLGSRAYSKRHISLKHRPLFLTFFVYHKHLLSTDDKSSSKACRVIAKTLINELDSYLREIKPPESLHKTEQSLPDARWMDSSAALESEKVTDENQLIDISHGGGRYFVKKFLSSATSGYHLEQSGGIGIQVHPHRHIIVTGGLTYGDCKKREIDRYSKNSLFYLDLPVRLTAKIAAKHLQAANNFSEAGLSPKAVSELVTPKIQILPSDQEETETWSFRRSLADQARASLGIFK